MNSGHLLREITAGSDEVSWILLVDNDLCREEFGVLAANRFEQFFDFLSIGEALIRVFMQSVKTFRHDLGTPFEAHAPFIAVVKRVQLGFGNSRSFAKFALAVVVVHPCQVSASTIFR